MAVCRLGRRGGQPGADRDGWAPANDFEAIPGYWSRTADWLDGNAHDTTAVLVPGSSFGFYMWGDPDDEPLQPLRLVAVGRAQRGAARARRQHPDARRHRGPAGLRATLGRSGRLPASRRHRTPRRPQRPPVRRPTRTGARPPGARRLPGIRRVADFGPKVGSPARIGGSRRNTVIDDGWVQPVPGRGDLRGRAARSGPSSRRGARLVVGGPEDLLDLTEAGLLGDEPTMLAVDAPTDVDSSSLVLTDGLRRRETNFARIQDGNVSHPRGRRRRAAGAHRRATTRWVTVAGRRTPRSSGARQPGGVVVACLRRHPGSGAPGDAAVRRLRRAARHGVAVRADDRAPAVDRDRVRQPQSRPERERGRRRGGRPTTRTPSGSG